MDYDIMNYNSNIMNDNDIMNYNDNFLFAEELLQRSAAFWRMLTFPPQ